MCNVKSAPHRLGKVKSLVPGAIRLLFMLSVIAGTTIASGAELVTKETDMQAIFFLDKYAISQAIDMEHRFFQPERVDGLITLDHGPGGSMAYFNIYYDQDAQLYQAWYRIGGGGSAFCYAESRDGVNWENPQLPEDTDRVTPIRRNAVFSGEVDARKGVVSYDPYDPDASRRYKLPYEENKEVMRMAYSPDGVHWRIDPGPTWHPGVRADTGNQIFYNPFTERYQVMTRASSVDRRIAMIESADLKTWSDPRVLLHPGPDDPVGMEFYGMPVCPYEDIFLGLLWKFQTGTTTAKSTPRRNDGIIEPELTYSYNGLIWNRTHRTLIERSQRGPYLGARIYPESILINHEGGISIYSRGYGDEHGSESDAGEQGVILHKMRRDGFAGMESIGFEGYLQTKVFVLRGADLTLNVNAPYGSVKVQISNRTGKPFPGFSFEDCVEWRGDDFAYRPEWNDNRNVDELVGEEVRFEIKMKEGILYSIRVPVNPGFMIPPMKRM